MGYPVYKTTPEKEKQDLDDADYYLPSTLFYKREKGKG